MVDLSQANTRTKVKTNLYKSEKNPFHIETDPKAFQMGSNGTSSELTRYLASILYNRHSYFARKKLVMTKRAFHLFTGLGDFAPMYSILSALEVKSSKISPHVYLQNLDITDPFYLNLRAYKGMFFDPVHNNLVIFLQTLIPKVNPNKDSGAEGFGYNVQTIILDIIKPVFPPSPGKLNDAQVLNREISCFDFW